MNDQATNADQPEPTEAPKSPDVDLEALTLAVERLLRRELALERERLDGGTRTDQRW